MPNPEWRDDAACRGHNPEWWFREGAYSLRAKAICASCPVQVQCLQYALNNREQHGIWGGMDITDRRPLHSRAPTRISCRHGHPLTADNLLQTAAGPRCLRCKKAWDHENRHKRRQEREKARCQ